MVAGKSVNTVPLHVIKIMVQEIKKMDVSKKLENVIIFT